MKLLELKVILVTICILPICFGVKILQFENERGEGSAVIRNYILKQRPLNITFCLDFSLKIVKPTRLLLTTGSEDLSITIPESLDRLYTQIKGIWYLTPAIDLLGPYNFGTYCMSYDSEQHRVIFAYNGIILFEKTDPNLLGASTFSESFPGNIELGPSNKYESFTGDITRLNIWSRAMKTDQLKIKSSCDGFEDIIAEVGDPDLLNWELVEWETPDGVRIKKTKASPCISNQKDIFDVLMPNPAEDLYDAIDTCTVLGGKMGTPDSDEDMKRMIAAFEKDIDKIDCIDSLWIPYHKNSEGKWTLYDGTKESRLPEFFKEPPWLEWEKSQPNGLDMEECTKISLGESPFIYDIDCHTPHYCFMCEFEDITKFTIRGLCNNLDHILDIQYLVDMDRVRQNLDKGIIWTGYSHSRIMFNKTLQRWTITSLSDARPILTLVNKVTGTI